MGKNYLGQKVRRVNKQPYNLIGTGPLMVSNRSYAASAEGGKARVSLTRIIWEKTDYSSGVRNVHINQPKSLVKEGRLWRIENVLNGLELDDREISR